MAELLVCLVLRRRRAKRDGAGGSVAEDKREKTQIRPLPNQEKSQY